MQLFLHKANLSVAREEPVPVAYVLKLHLAGPKGGSAASHLIAWKLGLEQQYLEKQEPP